MFMPLLMRRSAGFNNMLHGAGFEAGCRYQVPGVTQVGAPLGFKSKALAWGVSRGAPKVGPG